MALRKHESAALRLAITLIHLSVWAQLGVLTRAFLGKFFLLGCDGSWGPCMQGSLYFKDLPSNMLGSFVIGLFAASSVLGLAVDKAMGLLPRGHPWQGNFELQIGIRTGYCGSLTTFASWMLELLEPAVKQNLWVEAVMGIVVGMMAAVCSYSFGMHAALAADRWLVGEADVLEQMQRYRSAQAEQIEGLRADSGEAPSERLLMQAEPDIPRIVQHEPPVAAALHRMLHPGAAAADEAAVVAAAAGADGAAQAADGATAKAAAAAAGDGSSGEPGSKASSDGAAAAPGGKPPPGGAPLKRLSAREFGAALAGYKTDAVALAALAALSAGAAVGVALQRDHEWLRSIWLSVLLGPPGCILRWHLSRFNYKLRGSWDWLPAGTLAANGLGTSTDFLLAALATRRGDAMSYWGGLALGAVQTGFCGSLTTVSTFVTEVVKFAEAVPENFNAFRYSLLSLGGGVLLGLALFGWSVWAFE